MNNKLIKWIIYCLLLSSSIALNAQNFTEHTINGTFNGATDVFVIDLDADGDLDILATARNADDVTWFENGGSENFTEHTIKGNFNGAERVIAIDLDGDGDLDVLATAVLADDVLWFENDGSESFTEHSVDLNLDGAEGINGIDVDGDGDIDIVATGASADDVVWYENDGNQAFTKHIIDANLDQPETVVSIDFDNDGDIDVVTMGKRADEVVWYKNDGLQNFTKNIINANFNGAKGVFVIDLDADGDLDVVGAAVDADDVAWFENDGLQNFTEHTIEGNFNGAGSVFAIDINNDGNIDVVASAENDDDIAWFENDGNENFTKHTIIGNFDFAKNIFAIDLDGDTDVDVLGAAFSADDVTWWESDLAVSPDFLVINTNDAGAGSLRQAILNANAAAGSNIIQFDIPGAGVHTISLLSPLPIINGSLAIDAATQPGFAGDPIIELDGSAQNTGDVLNMNGLSGVNLIKALIMNGSPNNGISINNCADVEINNCLIGTNATGTSADANNTNGILINNSTGTIIDKCTLSGNNQNGLSSTGTASGNIIKNCKIGANTAGTAALANANHGIHLNGNGSNTIGGNTTGDRNIISGNTNDGIRISSSSNTIINNFIGTDGNGDAGLGNGTDGIFLDGGHNANIIGTPVAGNVISGNNGDGVEANSIGSSVTTLFQNNIIGLNAAGTAILGNAQSGIRLLANAFKIDIGGSLGSQGNIISGNGQDGIIAILTDGNNIDIFGNFIGTNAGGVLNLGNIGAGIRFLGANDFTIGGNGNRLNTIAFNGDNGIKIDEHTGSSTESQDIELTKNIIFDNTTKGILHTAAQTAVATPILTSAIIAGVFTVEGTLAGKANTTYNLEFFKNTAANSSGNHEGKIFISSANITTDGGGNAVISEVIAAANNGEFITATATENNKNTSEFSNGIEATVAGAPTNDNCGGAIPITPSVAGTGCSSPTFGLPFSTDGTTDSGVPQVCDVNPGNDQWFTWTATSIELLFSSASPGNPGIAIFANCSNAGNGTQIDCVNTNTTNTRLSGWSEGDDLLIQIYDSQNASANVAFCLEEFEPLVNDFCAGAIPIMPSASGSLCSSSTFLLPFSSDGTTDSGVPRVCTEPGNDQWFTWVATTEQLLFDSGNPGNPGIALYTSCANAAAGIDITCDGPFVNNRILEGWNIGDEIFIQIYDFQTHFSDVAFCLELVQPPVNDDCGGAIPIIPKVQGTGCFANTVFSLPFTLDGTTDSGVPIVCNDPGNDQWFTWTATSPSLLFNSANPGAPGIAIFANCANAGTGTQIDCADTQSTNTLLTGWNIGDNLLIQIYDFQGAASDVTFCLEEFTPPVNDFCAGAVPIAPAVAGTGCSSAGFTIPFSSDGTTDSGVPQVCINPGNDQWFTWTATTNGLLFSSISSGFPGMAVFANCTDAANGNDIDCSGTGIVNNVLQGWSIGDNLIIQIYDAQGANSTVAFCLEEFTVLPPPANDLCGGAIPITPSPQGTGCSSPTFGLSFFTDGTTDSGVPAVCSNPGKDQWFTWKAITLELLYNSEGPGLPGIAIFANCTDAANGNDITCGNTGTSDNFLSGWNLGDTLLIQIYDFQNANSDVAFCLEEFDPSPPPANDECAGATILAVSPNANCTTAVSATLLGATESPQLEGCNFTSFQIDVWFSFVATAIRHEVQLSNIVGDTQPFFQLSDGTCGTLNELNCKKFSSTGSETLETLVPGTTYFIRLSSISVNFADPSNFDICVVTPLQPPSNDECVNAIGLTVNADFSCAQFTSGTFVGASKSSQFENCSGIFNHDVWYTFVATATAHRIDVSNLVGGDDLTIQVAEGGCGAGVYSELECGNEPGVSVTGLTPSNTYFVRVSTESGDISTFDLCVGTQPPPPANDECNGAILLTAEATETCNNTVSGTLHGATESADALNCFFTDYRDDVWFKFVATATGHSVQLSNIVNVHFGANSTTDLQFQLAEGNCGSIIQLFCHDDPDDIIFIGGLTISNTYFIRIASKVSPGISRRTTTFDICVGTPAAIPANDECDNAIALTVDSDLNCTSTTFGTVLNATASPQSENCSGTFNHDVWFSFVATAITHDIFLSNITGSNPFLKYQILEAPCATPISIFCNTRHTPADNVERVAGLTIGTTYFIRINTLGSNPESTTFNICVGTPPPPPVNDECAGAIVLTVNPNQICTSFASGNFFTATKSPESDQCAGNFDDDIWYSFVATQVTHQVNVFNIVGTENDLVYEIFEGNSCGALTQFKCQDTPNGTILLTGLTPGDNYFIRVATFTAAERLATTFDICVIVPLLDVATGTVENCESIAPRILSGSKFFDFLDANGDIVCSINPNGNNLGSTTVDFFTTTSDRQSNNTFVMRRDLTITPLFQPATPVTVRLFYTSAELTALIAANTNVSDLADVAYTKSPLGCMGTISEGSLVPQLLSGNFSTQGDVFIQIETSSFSTFFAHASGESVALPVELVAFTAQPFEKHIQLNWTTATELNNKGFFLERWTENTSIETLAFINGKASTSFESHYSFIDDKAEAGIQYFYRLKQIDFDGQFEYSSIIKAAIKGKGFMVGNIYPNPASNKVTLALSKKHHQSIIINIFDAFGRVVPIEPLYFEKKIELDVHSWPSGVYHISLQIEGERYEQSLIVK